MSSDWHCVPIENVADVRSGKRLPKGHKLTERETLFPYIRLVDIQNGKVDGENILYLENETRLLISKYIVDGGDVVLAIVGNTIGMVFQVDKSWNQANLTENAARITNFSKELNPRYLYYYLTSNIGQSEILSRKIGSAVVLQNHGTT
jgi:type I restriction enzyme S subunit